MADAADAPLPIVDRPHAPVVYFEGAPTFAHRNGLIAITLSALFEVPKGAGPTVQTSELVTGYLRTNIVGAFILRDSLDKALLLADARGGAVKN